MGRAGGTPSWARQLRLPPRSCLACVQTVMVAVVIVVVVTVRVMAASLSHSLRTQSLFSIEAERHRVRVVWAVTQEQWVKPAGTREGRRERGGERETRIPARKKKERETKGSSRMGSWRGREGGGERGAVRLSSPSPLPCARRRSSSLSLSLPRRILFSVLVERTNNNNNTKKHKQRR